MRVLRSERLSPTHQERAAETASTSQPQVPKRALAALTRDLCSSTERLARSRHMGSTLKMTAVFDSRTKAPTPYTPPS